MLNTDDRSISRRRFLKFAPATTLGSLISLDGFGQSSKASASKTVLGIGAHYDDCIFGIPGILLKAVGQGHRVVIISILGDYSNWRKVKGREKALLADTISLCKDFGVEKQFLDFKSMNFDMDTAAQRVVAKAVADVRPDIALMLWHNDRSVPHQRAAQLSKASLLFGDYTLNNSTGFRRPNRIYEYDNGPRHTIDFEPNTFVDITFEWPRAAEWLGRLMALRDNQPYDPNNIPNSVHAKETLARYRGATCAVQYAEALHAIYEYPQEIF